MHGPRPSCCLRGRPSARAATPEPARPAAPQKPNARARPEARGKPAYVTLAAIVEGAWPANNAYSRVAVLDDCSIVVQGFGSGGYNATLVGPHPNCSLRL